MDLRFAMCHPGMETRNILAKSSAQAFKYSGGGGKENIYK